MARNVLPLAATALLALVANPVFAAELDDKDATSEASATTSDVAEKKASKKRNNNQAKPEGGLFIHYPLRAIVQHDTNSIAWII